MARSPDFPGKKMVLLVDDDNVCRALTRRLLVKLGYQVESAHSGEEALAIFRERPADLVLTDQIMSGMTGAELARVLKQLAPSTRVALYTSSTPVDTSCLDLILEKPVKSERLECSLEQLLGHDQPLTRTDQSL